MAVRDLSIICVASVTALVFAYYVDVFPNDDGVSVHANTIELDEALLIGGLVACGLLIFSLRLYRAQKREMAARIAAENQARELAYQDGLTGLPNRRLYDEALNAAISTPPRAGASHAVFLLDLNDFKQVNDVHGHPAGDRVLAIVAQRLRTVLRGCDVIARFGGDEFAMLAMHLSDPEAATNLALRIIDAVSVPVSTGAAVHRIGVGIGIALIPGDAMTAEEALRKADVALYRAKSERRSALRFFEPAMDQRVQERASMEQALRAAMESGRIETVFQPIVSLHTRRVIGFEASPRWIQQDERDIGVERFIAIAEEVGLIHALAERVLRQACTAARSWPSHATVSVDIYPSQLKDHLLPARILRILEETGLAPERLEVDITESALVADLENAQSVLGALRRAGVRIALDHFGAGYSSLYHLRNFKLDKLKIDRSFIQAMASERASANIVNALVGLGHGMGFTIAADGVEAPEQEASLLSSGCDQAQGRLFSAPISAQLAQRMFADESTFVRRLIRPGA